MSEATIADRLPQVSVLLPVHNGAGTIEASIASILSQTFESFELVVVDDGSTDATAELLAAIKDPRLRVITLTQNVGLIAALNIGVEQCRAELIARTDADDIALPTRLEHQVDVFRQSDTIVLSPTSFERCHPDGSVLYVSTPPATHGEAAIRMLVGNCFAHSCVMFKRSAVLEVGGYDPAWPLVEDYDLWFRLMKIGEYRGLSSVEMRVVNNPDGVSAASSSEQRRQISRRTSEALRELGAAPSELTMAGPSPVPCRTGPSGIRMMARSARHINNDVKSRRLPRRGLFRRAAANMYAAASWKSPLGKRLQVLLVAPATALRGKLDRR